MAHARLFVGLMLLVFAQVAPAAEPGRIGQAVLLKKANARILHTDAKGAVVPVTLTRTHYYVREERDGCVRIRQQDVDGWLDLRDVLSPEQAIAFFTEQIRAEPTNARAYLMRGTAWDVREDADKALADYNEAARLDPTNPTAFVRRGAIRSEKKEYDRALADFDAVVRRDPKCAAAYYYRGYARYCQKEYDAALADFDTVLRLDPTDSEAAAYRGVVWAERGDLVRAMTELDAAIALDPGCPSAIYDRGVVWTMREELGKALRDFDTALRLDPTSATTYSGRGGVLVFRGDYERALADLNQAVRLSPLKASYTNRGTAFYNRGDYAHAFADYTEAVRQNPNDAMAWHNKAWFLAVCADAKYRDGKAALTCATRACELTEYRNPRMLSGLAAAHAEAGNFAEAVKRQTKARDLAPPASMAACLVMLDTFEAGKPYRETPGASRTCPGLFGASVLLKTDRARLVRSPDGPPDYVATLRRPGYVVLEQKGDWLKLREKGVEGWLKRTEVLLFDEADDYFSERLQANPHDARAYRLRAAARRGRAAPELVFKDADEAIRLAPTEVQGYLVRGALRLESGNLDAALPNFEEAIRLDPADPDGWDYRAGVYFLQGEIEKGLADASEAIRLDPTMDTALVKKAFLLATHPEAKYRDGKTAVDLALKACELTEYLECKPLLTLAAALAETGNFAEAVKWQTRACQLATLPEQAPCGTLLNLFRTGKPYRQVLPGAPPFSPASLRSTTDEATKP